MLQYIDNQSVDVFHCFIIIFTLAALLRRMFFIISNLFYFIGINEVKSASTTFRIQILQAAWFSWYVNVGLPYRKKIMQAVSFGDLALG